MECVGNSDTSNKHKDPAGAEPSALEPKVGDLGNAMEIVKKENNSEQSGTEIAGGDSEMENILGALGKFLYNKKRRMARKKKTPAAKRRRKLKINYRAMDAKIAQKLVHDRAGHTNKRNWNKLSIYPFINFMRLFRKTIPNVFPLDFMVTTAQHIWKRMYREEKLPFIMKAKRAIHKGYID